MVFLTGFFQLKDDAAETYEQMNQSFSSAVMNISRAINGEQESRGNENREKEENDNPVFLVNSGFLLNNTSNLVLLFSFLMFFLLMSFGVLKNIEKSNSISSKIKYYMAWCLKFLNPIQKSIFNRSDEYDINTIKNLFVSETRTFLCGFFYWKKQSENT